MSHKKQHLFLVLTLALVAPPLSAQATNSFEACTTGILLNCAFIQVTTQLGVGPGGLNVFNVAISNLGSFANPALPTTIYNVVFETGQPDADPGTEVDSVESPTPIGGIAISDPAAWDFFDGGSAIFLSALSGNGVGGCVAGPPMGGFNQAANTCDSSQSLSFSLFTPRNYDPSTLTLSDLEVVALSPDLAGDSCGDGNPCTNAPVTPTPEPTALVLVFSGLFCLAASGAVGRHVNKKPVGTSR